MDWMTTESRWIGIWSWDGTKKPKVTLIEGVQSFIFYTVPFK